MNTTLRILSIDETRYMLGKFDKGIAFLFILENTIFKPTQVESLQNGTQKFYKQIIDKTIQNQMFIDYLKQMFLRASWHTNSFHIRGNDRCPSSWVGPSNGLRLVPKTKWTDVNPVLLVVIPTHWLWLAWYEWCPDLGYAVICSYATMTPPPPTPTPTPTHPTPPGPCCNMKTVFPGMGPWWRIRRPWPSYVYLEDTSTSKTTPLYWDKLV